MAMRVTLDQDFQFDDNTASIIQEATNRGLKNFTILPNGDLIQTDNQLKYCLVP